MRWQQQQPDSQALAQHIEETVFKRSTEARIFSATAELHPEQIRHIEKVIKKFISACQSLKKNNSRNEARYLKALTDTHEEITLATEHMLKQTSQAISISENEKIKKYAGKMLTLGQDHMLEIIEGLLEKMHMKFDKESSDNAMRVELVLHDYANCLPYSDKQKQRLRQAATVAGGLRQMLNKQSTTIPREVTAHERDMTAKTLRLFHQLHWRDTLYADYTEKISDEKPKSRKNFQKICQSEMRKAQRLMDKIFSLSADQKEKQIKTLVKDCEIYEDGGEQKQIKQANIHRLRLKNFALKEGKLTNENEDALIEADAIITSMSQTIFESLNRKKIDQTEAAAIAIVIGNAFRQKKYREVESVIKSKAKEDFTVENLLQMRAPSRIRGPFAMRTPELPSIVIYLLRSISRFLKELLKNSVRKNYHCTALFSTKKVPTGKGDPMAEPIDAGKMEFVANPEKQPLLASNAEI